MPLQLSHYLDCLRINSEETGKLKSFLSFNSGNEDYIYNQLYSTGDHFVGSNINTEKLMGLSIGKTNSPITGTGYFGGEDLVRIGYRIPFSGWSMVMDISPSFCNYRSENNLSRVLVSTMNSENSPSGFHVGINQSNRLYIQYNHNQETNIHTLPKEINANSVIAISEGVSDLSIYYKDLYGDANHSINLSKNKISYSDSLFVGGFNCNENTEYTGYQGYINSLALSSGEFVKRNISNQCDCIFAGGISVDSVTYSGSTYITTGKVETAIYETGVTGYETATGYFTKATGLSEGGEVVSGCECVFVDGSTTGSGVFTLEYQSALTGLIQVGVNVTFLTGSGIVTGHTVTTSGVDYDEAKLKFYSRYFLNFRDSLSSGEKIEIQTFDNPRYDLGLIPESDFEISGGKTRLYYHGAFNQFSGDKSYPVETHEFDYEINKLGEKYYLSGYPTGESYITYDMVDTGSICIDFSGDWSGHRIPTGGGGYYPDRPQFIETGYSHSNTSITITGILGESGGIQIHDRDVYINGQKLMYGESHGYTTGIYTQSGFTGAALFLSSGLPGWDYTDLGTGNLPIDAYVPEICFVPQSSGEKPSVIKKSIRGCSIEPYCSSSQYTTKEACEAPGDCSNSTFTTKATCETNGYDWTHDHTWTDTHGTKAICETAGGIWEAGGIDGIPNPISGYSELIWLNGLRQQGNIDYRRGLECSLSNSFTIFEESPLIFYNNNTDILNMQ